MQTVVQPVMHTAAPDGLILSRPAPGLLLILLPAGADRTRLTARQRIRLALRTVLARELSLPPDTVEVISPPAVAPHLAWPGGAVACSISHEDELSVAAIYLHGAVGIDLMRVQDVPDWRSVARDYLGAAVEKTLAALAPEARPFAFAAAWTAHEAGLKCRGMALTEWSDQVVEQTATQVAEQAAKQAAAPSMMTMALQLREGLAGAVALAPGPHGIRPGLR